MSEFLRPNPIHEIKIWRQRIWAGWKPSFYRVLSYERTKRQSPCHLALQKAFPSQVTRSRRHGSRSPKEPRSGEQRFPVSKREGDEGGKWMKMVERNLLLCQTGCFCQGSNGIQRQCVGRGQGTSTSRSTRKHSDWWRWRRCSTKHSLYSLAHWTHVFARSVFMSARRPKLGLTARLCPRQNNSDESFWYFQLFISFQPGWVPQRRYTARGHRRVQDEAVVDLTWSWQFEIWRSSEALAFSATTRMALYELTLALSTLRCHKSQGYNMLQPTKKTRRDQWMGAPRHFGLTIDPRAKMLSAINKGNKPSSICQQRGCRSLPCWRSALSKLSCSGASGCFWSSSATPNLLMRLGKDFQEYQYLGATRRIRSDRAHCHSASFSHLVAEPILAHRICWRVGSMFLHSMFRILSTCNELWLV